MPLIAKNTSHLILKRHWISHGEITTVKNDNHVSSEEKHIEYLVRFIIRDRLPYRLVESSAFRKFCKQLNPAKTIISRKSFDHIMSRGTASVEDEIIAKLNQVPSIALTFDIWSPRVASTSYACLTGHFLYENDELHSLILSFEALPYPHDGLFATLLSK